MKIIIIICLLLAATMTFSQTPLKPFPQHAEYTSGIIKPNKYTQSQLDDSVRSFYDQWKTVYLRNDCGAGQYYVWFDETSSNNSICVSEGQGYGMLITAYMAGYDDTAKTYFDGLYNYYKAHPSVKNPYLMAWNQITGCVDDPAGGNYSASDGDLDIAYALLLADKQWGSGAKINYLSEALNIINAIKKDDINKNIWTVKLGDWVNIDSADYDDTRPSDFMPDHFRTFQSAANDNDWTKVSDKCYSLIEIIQTNFSTATGLLPDFIQNCNTAPAPARPNYLESAHDGEFYYNACRTPWRIAMDYLISGNIKAKRAIDKINNWIKIKTDNNPTQIGAGYYLNGSDISGNNYSAAAFIGPLAVAAMVNSSDQTWLNNIYNHLLSLQLPANSYYNNTLKLLTLLVISGNWWSPLTITSIDNKFLLISEISVHPNPFSKFSVISYLLTVGGNVKIDIYNTLGEKITTLVDEWQEAGKHSAVFDVGTRHAVSLPSGIYYYTIRIGDRIESGKLILIK